MNLESLKKAIVLLLLLIAGILLTRIYRTETGTILGESLSTLYKTRIFCFILAFFVYLPGIYLFAVRGQQVLYSIGYDLKSKGLVPVILGGIFANNMTPASTAGGRFTNLLLRGV